MTITGLLQTVNRASLLAIAARSTAASLPSTPAFTAFTFNPSILQLNSKRIGSHSTTRLLSSPPTRYLLSYEYIPDVLEKRVPYREGHLGLANDMIEKGTCISGGPMLSPGEGVPKGALFVFTTKEAAEKFVAEDPYVSGGIVTGHSIDEWNVVVGCN
ncbi:hypothetical protein ACHAXS_001024 [Conticribra weissflogii]